MSTGRPWWVAAAVVAAMGPTGCTVIKTSEPPIGAPPTTPVSSAWREPSDYTYTVDSQCGERLLIGRVRLMVSRGAVVSAEGLDEPGRRIAETAKLSSLPTLRQLLDEYDDARNDGAAVARVAFDPVDGHPTRIDLDQSANSIDDEACYVITDYSTAPVPT